MKSKGSASLYEVLKSASRPGSDPTPASAPAPEPPAASEGQKTLQERLAEYKARKLASVQTAAPASSTATAVADPTPIPVAVADPTPPPASFPLPTISVPPHAAPSTHVLTPLPTPSSVPAAGPGERVFKVTYNTAAFAALVVVGLAFVSYAVGVKVGRARAAESSSEMTMDVAKPPPPAPKVYSIRLVEWPSRNAQEHVNSVIAADNCKKALERAGFKNIESVKIMRGGEERLALYLDRVRDPNADSAKARLAAVQKVKVQNQLPFAQAGFEEVPKEAPKPEQPR